MKLCVQNTLAKTVIMIIEIITIKHYKNNNSVTFIAVLSFLCIQWSDLVEEKQEK